MTRSKKQKTIINFNDHKEKELGDIGIFKDEKEFNDYKKF